MVDTNHKPERKLNFHEKLLKFLKHQKQRIPIHLMIAFPLAIILFSIFYFVDGREAPEVEQPNDAVVSGAFVGDIMTGRYVEEITSRHSHSYLFRYVQPFFDASDYVTGNVENPITEREDEEREGKSITLRGEKEAVYAMDEAGFSTAALANNHTMDYGENALVDTLQAFDYSGIDGIGAGANMKEAQERISYQEKNGMTIATLSFSDIGGEAAVANEESPGILNFNPEVFVPMTAEANKHADLVIVHAHWGHEYNSRVSDRQRELAYALSHAGADIIIGHHPHVLESAEVYDGTAIFYSLGNFVFDQGWTRTRETALGQFHVLDSGETRFELTPMKIREASPAPLTSMDKLAEWSITRQLTRDLHVDWENVDGKIVFTVDQQLELEDTEIGGGEQ